MTAHGSKGPSLTSALFLTSTLFTSAFSLTADFDQSGEVEMQDFFLFGDVFGQEVIDTNRRFDLNSDGNIDFDDFFVFCDAYGGGFDPSVSFWPLQLGNSWTYIRREQSGMFPPDTVTVTLALEDVVTISEATYFRVRLPFFEEWIWRRDLAGNIWGNGIDGLFTAEYNNLFFEFSDNEQYSGREWEYFAGRDDLVSGRVPCSLPVPYGTSLNDGMEIRRFYSFHEGCPGSACNYYYAFSKGIGPISMGSSCPNHPHSESCRLIRARINNVEIDMPESISK